MEDMLTTSKNEDNNEEVQYELMTSLKPNQQRFIDLYVTGQYTQQKLAQLLDVHINTIRAWLSKPEIDECITAIQSAQHKQVGVQLKAMTNKAINTMNKLMDSPIDGVALQAAKDILDRGGHKAKQEIKKEVTVTTYEQQLQNVINSAIDVDFVEIADQQGDDSNEQCNTN